MWWRRGAVVNPGFYAPKGQTNVAQGNALGVRTNQVIAPKGGLIPNITFIPLDFIFFQEFKVFVLKCLLAVMLFLIANVTRYFGDV